MRRFKKIFLHIPFERSNLLSWEFEFFTGFVFKVLDELISVGYQSLWTKAQSQNISNIIILLTILAAAPVNIGSQSGRWKEDGNTKVLHSLDSLILMEHLMRELWIEKLFLFR